MLCLLSSRSPVAITDHTFWREFLGENALAGMVTPGVRDATIAAYTLTGAPRHCHEAISS